MKLLAAIGALLIALAVPAKATEWLNCSDGDKASFNVLLGNMNVIAVDTIEIEAADKKWSTGVGMHAHHQGQASKPLTRFTLM
jgi:hypothetical protein